jgi:hypothetical protein
VKILPHLLHEIVRAVAGVNELICVLEPGQEFVGECHNQPHVFETGRGPGCVGQYIESYRPSHQTRL